jgi:hypothetical protein
LNFMFVTAKEMLTTTNTWNLTALNATRKADTVFIWHLYCIYSVTFWPIKMKAIHSFRTLLVTHPITLHHIPQDLNCQKVMREIQTLQTSSC